MQIKKQQTFSSQKEKTSQSRVIVQPSQFVFPPLKQTTKFQKGFIIKNVPKQLQYKPPLQSENYQRIQNAAVSLNGLVVRNGVQISNRQKITYNYSIPIQKKKASLSVSANYQNQISQPTQIINNQKNKLQEIEQSIGGSSIYQFSEFDKSENTITMILEAISKKEKLLPIIDELCEVDNMDLKGISQKLLMPLTQELIENKFNSTTVNWVKGFAIFIGILEECLFRHDLKIDTQSLEQLFGVTFSLPCLEILSNLIMRIGQQVVFVKEDNIKVLALISNLVILSITNVHNLPELQTVNLVRGFNQIFRLHKVREQLKQQSPSEVYGDTAKIILTNLQMMESPNSNPIMLSLKNQYISHYMSNVLCNISKFCQQK